MWKASRAPSAVLAAIAVLVPAVLSGDPAAGRDGTGLLRVVATFYPLAYAAEQVGGPRVRVTNLTPAGVDPHDLDLTPRQVDQLLDADLVIDLGRGFQPAVERAASQRDGPTLRVLDRLPLGRAATGKQVDEDDPDSLDPHVWLDPRHMADIATLVQRALVRADPAGRPAYRANGAALRDELAALDARFREGLAHCDRRLIVTAHESFGYLAARYGLRQEGAAGLSPDAEPDPRRIAELADLVRREGVTVVFTEELVSPRVAETLAREAGVRTETLDPLEGLSRAARRAGADYVSVMDENLESLRDALGCR